MYSWGIKPPFSPHCPPISWAEFTYIARSVEEQSWLGKTTLAADFRPTSQNNISSETTKDDAI